MTKYRHLEIENFVGVTTAQEIAEIEQKLGVELPADFVAWLQVANGGYIEYAIDVRIEESGKTEGFCFCELYGTRNQYNDGSDESVFLGEIDRARRYKNAPHEVLPFASDGGSSVVYLDLTPEGAGRVVAFIDGLPAWTGLRQNNAYVELAPSFGEYIDKLYLLPEDE